MEIPEEAMEAVATHWRCLCCLKFHPLTTVICPRCEKQSPDETNLAHERDYRFKGKLEAADHALAEVLEDEAASSSLGGKVVHLEEARKCLQARSAHIVAVWD
jgi:hypothetical protein